MTVQTSNFDTSIDTAIVDDADSQLSGTLAAAQHRKRHAQLGAYIKQTQTILGTGVKGAYASVAARLTANDSTVSSVSTVANTALSTANAALAASGGAATTSTIYCEDYGWLQTDTAGDTNRTAMRKAVKAGYDLIVAGAAGVTITWRASAGINIVNPGTGVGTSGSTTAVVDSSIVSTFNARAWCVLDSNMTLIVPTWMYIAWPTGYNSGTAGTHQFGITTTAVQSGNPAVTNVNVRIDGIIDGKGATYGSNANKVSAVAIFGCRNSRVDGIGNIKNWYGANGGSNEAWGVLHNGCTNAAVYGLLVNKDDGGLARTGVASQYTYGYEVSSVRVEGVEGQGISSYAGRDINVHDCRVRGVGLNAYNFEHCDNWELHDDTAGGLPQVSQGGTPYATVTSVAGQTTATSAGTATTSLPVASRSSFPQSGNFDILIGGTAATVTGGHGTGAGTFTLSATKTWLNGASVVSTFTFGTTTQLCVGSTLRFPAAGGFAIKNDTGDWQALTYTSKTANSFVGCAGGTGTASVGNQVDLGPCTNGVYVLAGGSAAVMNGTGFGKVRRVNARACISSDANQGSAIGIQNIDTATCGSGTTGSTIVPAPFTLTMSANATSTQTGATITLNGHTCTGDYTSGSKTITITSPGTIVPADSGVVTSSAAGIPGGTTATTNNWCQPGMKGMWVRVGGAANPVVKVSAVTADTSFTTDTPHGGTTGDTLYMIRGVVDIDDCDFQDSGAGAIHLAMSAASCLVAQQHSVRVNPTTRMINSNQNKDFRGAKPDGTAGSWAANTVPVSVSTGGAVTVIATPTVTLDQYVWNWSMCTIEYDFDLGGITAGAATGLIKLRGGGVAGATTNKTDLDVTIVNAAADYNKLGSRWTLRLAPGEGVIWKGGGTGFSAAPTIASQRIVVS